MSTPQGRFDWLRFPEGRARFAGGVRGWDEQWHEAFAVEINDREYFGEIEPAPLSNQNDYNIEVLSFGYGSDQSVGMPMLGSCERFTVAEVGTIQVLITQLIAAGMNFLDKPSILMESAKAHFMDKVIFRGGWVLVANQECGSNMAFRHEMEV